MNKPTPKEGGNLQFNYIALSVFYDAIDLKVFEQVKDLDFTYKVWKRLEDS